MNRHRCLRYCTLILLLVATTLSANAQSAYCLTNNTQQTWDEDVEAWDDFRRTLTTCDQRGNQLVVESQTHFFDEWDLGSRQLMTYDDADNLLERVRQKLNGDGTAYENDKRDTYEYDDQNRETLQQLDEWDGAAWRPVEREIQDSIDVGVAHSITQLWDAGSSTWVNDEREVSTLQDSSRTTESWDGAAWQPVDRSITSTGGGVTTITILDWDGSGWVNDQRLSYSDEFRKVESWDGSIWMNVQLQETTYDDDGNLLELLEKAWDDTGMAWMNDYRVTYTYNAAGIQTLFLLEEWEGGMWEDETRQVSTLDADGNETEEVWQDWDDIENEWVNVLRWLRTYEATGVGLESDPLFAGYVLEQNHPNPARTETTISFEVPATVAITGATNGVGAPASATLTLYDALGRRVRVLRDGRDIVGTGRVTLTVSVDNLASGVYYYQLRSGNATMTKTMVVSR